MATTRSDAVEPLRRDVGRRIRRCSILWGGLVLLLPSGGKLEQDFFAGLAKHLPEQQASHKKA
ncbi:MAG: hypothetical protein NZ578_17310 [Candidatus Binatia bacterium]|nr:hypothetical protein [Candidatus Binatia bacterium]